MPGQLAPATAGRAALWRGAWSRSADKAVRRVPTLAYALDETPPPGTIASMAMQHLLVLASLLLLPALAAAAAGASPAEAVDFVRLTMIGTGITTLLQCLPRGPVGSGYAVPATATPVFFGATVLAIKAGGLALAAGMTLFVGVLVLCIASVAHRLRPLFPAEVTGVIVVMIAFTLAPNGLRQMLTVAPEMSAVPRWAVLAVGALSFATMVAVTVQRRAIQRHGVLIGVAVGVPLALLLGVVRPDAGSILGDLPLVAAPPLPAALGLRFDWLLAIPFAVAALVSAAKGVGDLTVAQRANDAAWVRSDMGPLRRGLMASGLGNVVSGCIGGAGVGTSTSCIGITLATGVMSRAPVLVVGLILVVFGCVPKAAALIELMPPPVGGAMVLFVACFMTVSAVQLMTTRMLDARRTFVVGISLTVGLAAEMHGDLFQGLLAPSLVSGTTMAALSAIGLNLIFSAGGRRTGRLSVDLAGDIGQQISSGMDGFGGAWGARREVIYQVRQVVTELAELLAMRRPGGTFDLDFRFEEHRIQVTARFAGPALSLPTHRPTEDEIIADHTVLARYLIRSLSEEVIQQPYRESTRIVLRFQH